MTQNIHTNIHVRTLCVCMCLHVCVYVYRLSLIFYLLTSVSFLEVKVSLITRNKLTVKVLIKDKSEPGKHMDKSFLASFRLKRNTLTLEEQ